MLSFQFAPFVWLPSSLDMGRITQVARSTAAPLTGGQDAGGALSDRAPRAGSRQMTASLDGDGLDALAQRLADPVARRVIEMIKDEGVLAAPTAGALPPAIITKAIAPSRPQTIWG